MSKLLPAFVINLSRRADRWKSMQERWSQWFDLKRIEAVDMPGRGAEGCKRSHVQLAREVLAQEPFMVVLEDDCLATPAMETIGLACIEEAMQNVDDWDYANLGPLLDLSMIGLPKAELSPSPLRLFLRATYSHDTHAVLYNRRSLHLLRSALGSPVPLDMFLGRNSVDQIVPIRILATQDRSVSDIRRPFPQQHLWREDSERMLQEYET